MEKLLKFDFKKTKKHFENCNVFQPEENSNL